MNSRPYLLFALAISVAGCASPEIPYDHSSAGVQRLGLLTPGFPKEPSVVLASDPGQSFGLVGALVDAGLQGNRESKLKTMFVSQHVQPFDEFQSSLVAALKRDGYSVTVVPANFRRGDFVKGLVGDASIIDAYLDVVVKDYGYMAAGVGDSNPYRPFMILQCQLVRASDSSILMQDQVAINPLNGQASGWAAPKQVTVAPDPDFAFPDMGSMTASPEKAVAGVRSALAQSTTEISVLLK